MAFERYGRVRLHIHIRIRIHIHLFVCLFVLKCTTQIRVTCKFTLTCLQQWQMKFVDSLSMYMLLFSIISIKKCLAIYQWNAIEDSMTKATKYEFQLNCRIPEQSRKKRVLKRQASSHNSRTGFVCFNQLHLLLQFLTALFMKLILKVKCLLPFFEGEVWNLAKY